jgi:hypothetical protein
MGATPTLRHTMGNADFQSLTALDDLPEKNTKKLNNDEKKIK